MNHIISGWDLHHQQFHWHIRYRFQLHTYENKSNPLWRLHAYNSSLKIMTQKILLKIYFSIHTNKHLRRLDIFLTFRYHCHLHICLGHHLHAHKLYNSMCNSQTSRKEKQIFPLSFSRFFFSADLCLDALISLTTYPRVVFVSNGYWYAV